MSGPAKRPDPQGDVVVQQKTEKKLQRPRLYKVLFHNDDYTTMEFVVALLMAIFHHSEAEATAIMLHVHRNGVGVAGVYPYSVAEAKVQETMKAAEDAEYPLLVTMEPEDGPAHDDQ